MPDSFEQKLRSAMEALGRVVESIIGKAKEARVQVGVRSGVQPLLSVDGLLKTERIRDLIDISTQKVMGNAFPNIRGGNALEVGEGPPAYNDRMLSAQARMAVGVEIGGRSTERQGDISRGFVVRGQLLKLPFGDGRFSYVLARLATSFQSDMLRSMRELNRVMMFGGQGVVIDYHPFGLYSRKGMGHARPVDSGIHKLEDYYRMYRSIGLRVVDVREAFIDEGMRQFFKEEEIPAYRNLKGTPLLIFLFIYKPKAAVS